MPKGGYAAEPARKVVVESVVPADPKPLVPFWQTTDGTTARLYLGEVRDVLARMPEKSVHCCITSPPYWGLRDYGTGTWAGGDPACDHVERVAADAAKTSMLGPKRHLGISLPETNAAYKATARQIAVQCGKCGATRTDQQLGSEPSPDCMTWGKAQCGRCFVCNMVSVFRAVRRVLRDDATLFLNLGDSYSGGGGGNYGTGLSVRSHKTHPTSGRDKPRGDLPSGNLVGIPWRVSLALQADGWILRSDMPWIKRSSMPESVTNRPAKALEYVFLFAKKMGYYYDNDAIRKKTGSEASWEKYESGDGHRMPSGTRAEGIGVGFGPKTDSFTHPNGRNFRNADLWFQSVEPPHGVVGVGDEVVGLDIPSQSYEGAHFAVFGERLITPMVLAGTSAHGCCADCRSPWRRVTTREGGVIADDVKPESRDRTVGNRNGKGGSTLDGVVPTVKTLRWEPGCECHGKLVKVRAVKLGYGDYNVGDDTDVTGQSTSMSATAGNGREPREFPTTVVRYESDLPLDDHPVVPCTVLDPFVGSGTSVVVATDHGRNGVGIDLSEKYLRNNSVPRVEGALRARPVTAGLVPRKVVKIGGTNVTK